MQSVPNNSWDFLGIHKKFPVLFYFLDDANQRRLVSFCSYSVGWWGSGSRPARMDSLWACNGFISRNLDVFPFRAPITIHLLPRGNVVLVWEVLGVTRAELEFLPDTGIDYMVDFRFFGRVSPFRSESMVQLLRYLGRVKRVCDEAR